MKISSLFSGIALLVSTTLGAVVNGVISDMNGNPIDNIRIKFRGGIEGGGATRAFNTDWYYEDMIRVGEDGAYSFTVPDPGYSIDSNHIFMLFTVSGVNADTKIWNTVNSDRFLIPEGTETMTVNLQTSPIVYSAFTVKVVDAAGNGIDDARVGATLLVNAGGTEAGATGGNGVVQFEGAVPGDYRVTVQREGYLVQSSSYVLAENSTDTLVVTLTEGESVSTIGTVSGKLVDPEGNPIEGGVSVIKFGGKNDREIFVGISDANGEFTISGIPDTYLGVEGKIETGADGYRDAEELWTTTADGLTLEYTLTPVGGDGQGTAVTTMFTQPMSQITIENGAVCLEKEWLKGTVSLYTLQGKLLYQTTIENREIPLSSVGQGLYLILLQKGSKMNVSKMIMVP